MTGVESGTGAAAQDDWSDYPPPVPEMNQSDRALERLLNLYFELAHARIPISAADLRRRVPGYARYGDSEDGDAAFLRAFARDKETLRSAGIPILLGPVPATDPQIEGYRIDTSGALVELPDLWPDELAALRVAANIIRVGNTEIDQALWRLGGVIDTIPEEYGPPVFDSGTPVAELAIPPGLTELQEARSRCLVVRFRYKGDVREVEPLRVFYQRGWWYATAYDRTRSAQRHFRVDRVEPLNKKAPMVEITGESYDPEVHSPIERMADPWAWGHDEPVSATLRVDPGWVMSIVPGLPPDVQVERRDDGSADITLEVRNREGFRWLALGVLEHAEIIDPEELRDDMKDWLASMAGDGS